MLHECERKEGLIWECLMDSFGNLYCSSCGKKLSEDQIEPRVLKEIKRRIKND